MYNDVSEVVAKARAAIRGDSPTPSDKSDVEEDIQTGINAIRRGEYRHALHLLAPFTHTSVPATAAVEALRWSAEAHSRLGAYEQAERLLKEAEVRLPDVPQKHHATAFANISLRMAAASQRRHDDEGAVALQERAIAALDEGNRSHLPTLASAWNNLGITRLRLGDEPAAREAFTKACSFRQQVGDAEGYCLAAGNLLLINGDPAQVTKGLKEHLVTARNLGASKQHLRTMQVNLANYLEEASEWQESARSRRELFSLRVPPQAVGTVCACGAPTPPLRCGRCRDAFYCSEACQRAYWPAHKLECNPRDLAAERAKAVRDCPVCLEEVNLAKPTDATPVRILQCLHVLHASCWRSFEDARNLQGQAIQCPVCKDSLPLTA
mmetsp:Transcript_54445/g.100641  ORF Transcript_54445/g.100641 Transcript_54445/m.100641 type:complete len:381 (+) Transcript_54445:50-1192(+)